MSRSDRLDDAHVARLAERMRWRAASDAELVAAVRRGSYEALREFYARFEPLLARFAARAGVSLQHWEDDAHDVLCDVVLALLAAQGESRTRPREDVRNIHSYLQRAFRNRMLDARRAATRREQRDGHATSNEVSAGERVVLSTCSESAVRASGGSGSEAPPLSPAIARLAMILDAELSAGERQMLAWVGNAVPMRDVARWLGINYSAAKVRLSRTRGRLRVRALRHVSECMGAEREELIEFFRRSTGERQEVPVSPARMAEPGGTHGHD